jgi:alcohol dehydrogenase
VVAVDLSDDKLAYAMRLGAVGCVNASSCDDIADAIRELSQGGAHVSVDAIGNAAVCWNSINSLRKRGKHIQIGLMVGGNARPEIPMGKVLSNKLEILGSHGMQAHRYGEMMEMISAGRLSPEKLIGRTISLEESIDALTSMSEFGSRGVTIITEF